MLLFRQRVSHHDLHNIHVHVPFVGIEAYILLGVPRIREGSPGEEEQISCPHALTCTHKTM